MNNAGTAKLVVILCAVFAQAADRAEARDVFKWKDADGPIHFSDRRQQTDAEALTIRPGPGAAASSTNQQHLKEVLDEYTKQREALEATRSAERESAEQRNRACTFARGRQHTVEHANALYDYTATGERRVIEGEEYKRAIENARQAVLDSCD